MEGENKGKREEEEEEEDDMISKLPDALISEMILLYLPTKEAVRTSVLSNRWRSLWLLIPGLDLDSCEFLDYNAFSSFINTCLDFSREEKLCMHKLKLNIRKDENENENHHVTRWIDFVATRRKLKHLDVECFVKCLEVKVIPLRCLEVMPVSLFVCETLIYLRLRRVLFSNSSFNEESSVSLPRLKTLRLEQNVYLNETSVESLISYCPVLEDLTIGRRVDDNLKCLRVRSQTLTSIKIYVYRRILSKDDDDDKEVDFHVVRVYQNCGFFIDAPRLKYLNVEDDRFPIKTITNSGSLNKVILLGHCLLPFCKDQLRKFFTNFSGVRDMNLDLGPSMLMGMQPFPQFCNLSHFEVSLLGCYDTLLMFLPNCPNLRSLILNLTAYWERMRLESVKLSLLSSLEFVEIECEFRRYPNLELVSSNPQDTSHLFHTRRKFHRLK